MCSLGKLAEVISLLCSHVLPSLVVHVCISFVGVFDHPFFKEVMDYEDVCFMMALDQIYPYSVRPLEVGVDYLRFEGNHLDRQMDKFAKPRDLQEDVDFPPDVVASLKSWIKDAHTRWRRVHTDGFKSVMQTLDRRRAAWQRSVNQLRLQQDEQEEQLQKLREMMQE
jgi:hypothetical protein